MAFYQDGHTGMLASGFMSSRSFFHFLWHGSFCRIVAKYPVRSFLNDELASRLLNGYAHRDVVMPCTPKSLSMGSVCSSLSGSATRVSGCLP